MPQAPWVHCGAGLAPGRSGLLLFPSRGLATSAAVTPLEVCMRPVRTLTESGVFNLTGSVWKYGCSVLKKLKGVYAKKVMFSI